MELVVFAHNGPLTGGLGRWNGPGQPPTLLIRVPSTPVLPDPIQEGTHPMLTARGGARLAATSS